MQISGGVQLSGGINLVPGSGSPTPSGGGFQGSNFGYTSGGDLHPNSPRWSNTIDKFPFASDANATDVGDLTIARSGSCGQSSTVSGYNSGGNDGSQTATIDKFPFSSDGNSTYAADLTKTNWNGAGQSSADN